MHQGKDCQSQLIKTQGRRSDPFPAHRCMIVLNLLCRLNPGESTDPAQEASFLSVLAPPRPRTSFQSLKEAFVQESVSSSFWLHFCSLLPSSWLPPSSQQAKQMAQVPPQCLTCADWEESGSGGAHSGAGCSASTTGCLVQAVPSLKQKRASLQPRLVCMSAAAGRGEVAFSGGCRGSVSAT